MPQVKMNDLALISVEREELNVVNIIKTDLACSCHVNCTRPFYLFFNFRSPRSPSHFVGSRKKIIKIKRGITRFSTDLYQNLDLGRIKGPHTNYSRNISRWICLLRCFLLLHMIVMKISCGLFKAPVEGFNILL
jgi:hypothetical protein